ncbi:SpoIIE family protein phosphatase [Motilibacter aurantiacus]|uniref:SpoIIE family protein phosphatase n=1 Tax=Motilibacter aurantiacus TaxID=2714955 RepID=UPI00140D1C32|nr:SpoIIE family protein phosphatase [Motilibacter aurantiacus]NHC47570.1 SpoIIE family protein phosphatase [Motilibacter aurantiacus]
MHSSAPDVFRSGGAVGADLARVDWEATLLGPPEQWPQSLRAVVQLLLSSRFSMWMAWGPELTFFCNDAYRRDTLGKKYPWALGRPASEVWAEIWEDIGPRIDSVMTTGEATWDAGLLLFLQRSGFREETYHTFSYSPLRGDDDAIVGMLCVVSEDTERVIGERHLQTLSGLGAALASARTESEVVFAATSRLEEDLRSLPFALVYGLDEGGVSARLLGASGVRPGAPVAPPSLSADEGPVWPVKELADGRTVLVEGLADRFAEVPRGPWDGPPALALAVPFRQQADGPVYGFLVAGLSPFRPFDDAYRAFVELVAGQVAAGVATARAYESERLRAERLAELDRAKTAFFTNVSHEFRTPLTLLLGPAEDALTDSAAPLPGRQRDRVEVVVRNGQRLLKLVNDLLDFSRLEAGNRSAHFEPVDLAAETAELARAFSEAVERAGLTLTVDCAPLPERYWVDRDLWAKVVLNLLSNALKFTPTGGISVRLDAVDGGARLVVRDTGIGISEHDRQTLFDRFTRVAGVESRTHEGSGIGLALVAELTALHGGTVEVESMPGEGTAFLVTLPAGSAHLPADQLAAGPTPDSLAGQRASAFVAEAARWDGSGAAGASPEPSDAADGRPRVLVVDDNADMRDYVVGLLRADYAVTTAADGAAGLAAALEQPPDLVLTDVMMPKLDGFELLAELRRDPRTATTPVVMLSARAGEEATVEGLDAGADDYLVKPFSALELLARVRAALELDRVRRNRAQLQRQQELLDQAQRLARVGSWELDLASGAIVGSPEFRRQVGMSAAELLEGKGVSLPRVHPDDTARVRAAVEAAVQGAPMDYEVRIVLDGEVRTYRTIGALERDADGHPVRLYGSNQDVTEQREAERVVAAAAAAQEAAAREHSIADELQRSLLPARSFDPDHLEVATFYRAGVEGTQVGGDWYDVIELGAGRAALVLGDVMGRGVRAAAVMGQLRAAVRAYARLDLPPADLLELLDGVVRDLGDDQIVTCVYAVYDPSEQALTYANAGHLPPLLTLPEGGVRRLDGLAGPPLGAGQPGLREGRVTMPPGAGLLLYTDGLVERRDSDIDAGIDRLVAELERVGGLESGVPEALVSAMLPEGPDDDIAILLARVSGAGAARVATMDVPPDRSAVIDARHFVASTLTLWGVAPDRQDDVILLVSELVTNAIVHGRPPVELRIRHGADVVVLEVIDSAAYYPRRMRPTEDDEHGRGLQLVSLLADRWGTRPTGSGKAVWCVVPVG